ncbi:MAG: ATP-binding protein [Anaerolineae bacterium]|nr:ATP-binding protein [Anaerolineae bacterium]
MLNWLNRFSIRPDGEDHEKNQMAATLNIILLILLAASVFLMIDDWLTMNGQNLGALVLLGLVSAVSLGLTRRGRLTLPRFVVPLLGLVIVSYVILVNNLGIHDIGMLCYPAVIILAGLLLGKQAPFIFAWLSFGAIALIVYAEVNGLINSQLSFLTSYDDLITIAIILALTAALTQVLMNNLIENAEQARRHEAALLEAHRQLQTYTRQLEQQEQILRQSEAYLRAILNNLPFQVWLKDLEGRFLTVNEPLARAAGMPSIQTVIGKTDFDLTQKELAEKYRADDQEIIESKSQKTIEEIMFDQGQAKWFETYKRPILDEKGQVLGTTGFARDITERKQAEEEREALIKELEAKNAELERFTYTVSHDLKSPLVTIKGFLGWLEKDIAAGNTERMQHDFQHIREATTKMQNLLDDLLELSRIGRLMNPPQTVSVAELAREASQLVAGQIEARGAQVNIAPNLPLVSGDRPRLVEVFQNLIDNAIKFMGDQPAPCVDIGVREDEGEPIFFVRDNGSGIAARYHQRIFGLFERLEQNTEGTGVGLALVKRIVEVHGGRIWVESDGPGQGSTFYFTLPLTF